MKTPPANLLPRLAEAAELRLGGFSWETVAARVRRHPDTVRRWPHLYPEAWRRAWREAEERLLDDIGAESVLVLRKMLRSDDERLRRDAAKVLLAQRTRHVGRQAGRTAAPPVDESARLAAYLEAHDDAQIDALLDELLAARRSSVDGPAPARGGGSGAARPQ